MFPSRVHDDLLRLLLAYDAKSRTAGRLLDDYFKSARGSVHRVKHRYYTSNTDQHIMYQRSCSLGRRRIAGSALISAR